MRLPEKVERAIERKAKAIAVRADGVLISDYGFGAATPALVRKLDAKRITLDSRYRLLEFRDARVTAATPNEAELEAAYHERVGTDISRLEDLGARALRHLSLEALVVTRGKDGLALFERDSKATRARGLAARTSGAAAQHIPIHGSDTPVDVTGAGDTVIAVFTLALAAGASYLEAAHLANYAGGIVVMKRRTATVTRQELEANLRQAAAIR
jgi:D-glycero-beta-D-manno-heptose-7-phosphate kinase